MSRASDAERTRSPGPRRLSRGRLFWCAAILGVCLLCLAVLASQAASALAVVPPRLVVAQGLTDTTVELAWTAEAGADTYRVYRDGTLATEQPGTLYDDGSLQPSTFHTYAVSVVSAGIESLLSANATAQTQALADSTPPTQPGAIDVSGTTSSEAHLDWARSTDNVRIVGYRILRGPAGVPPSELVQVDTTDGSSSYDAANLRSGTDYQFGVIALDANNNHSPIRTVTFTTTSSADTTPPAAPSSLGVRTIPFSSSRVDVTWPSSSSSDVSGYRVYRDGTQFGDVALPLRKTFSDGGLTPGQSYTYTIRAVDSAGNLSSPTSGKVGTTPAAETVLIPRGPYIQWVTPNSARIAWWTNVPSASVVEYGAGILTDQVTDPVPRTQHMMLMGGLTPGSQYQYRVGDGTVVSGTFSFSTAATPGATFAFAAVGDFGGASPGEAEVADRIATGGTQFTQTVGDNVYPDAQDPDFATYYSDFDSRFFKQYAQVINKQAFWTGNGNKEYYGDGAHWRIFWLPNNERWYSYDWGDAHILVLDTEQPYTPGSPQYEFALADLSASQSAKWRIVITHRPAYSSTNSNSSSGPVQTNLVPLFEQQHVQLVLSGNSHNYERSHPLIGGAPATGGTVYVVTGGGGNGHNLFTIPQPAWSAFRNDTDYQYTRVTVSPQSLQLDAIRGDTGAVFDSTVINGPPDTGTIAVRKNLNPNGDPGRFDLQVDGQTKKSDAANGDTTGPVTVNTGTNHSVGELAGTGTSLSGYSSGISCTRNGSPAESGSGTSLAGITVGQGDAVVCTITNTRLGKIIVRKDAQPDDPQDFDFNAGGGLSPSSFSLDDDPTDATLSDTRTFGNLPPQSGYSVSETVSLTWDQLSATCDDGSLPSSIDVSAGETVTCTFTNSKTYEQPIGASPFRASLVPAFAPCRGSSNASHEPPLSGRSCNPPAPSSSAVAVGPESLGFERLIVLGSGQCAPFDSSHCYPDFTIRVDITDVRSASPTGPDYDPAGSTDLTAVATVPDYSGPATTGTFAQITDKNNKLDTGTLYNRAATVIALSFPVPMSCTPTTSTSTGSACNAQTTANTLLPGSAVVGRRAIWEIGQFQILDQGANGTPGDSDDQVFEAQGVVVP